MSIDFMVGGYFTAPTSQTYQVVLQAKPDLFYLENVTSWGDASAVTAVTSNWEKGLADGAAFIQTQAVTTNILSSGVLTSGGFTFVDTSNPPVFAALATSGTDIDKTTYVVTMSDTGTIAVGDWVRLYSTTAMLQVSSYAFQVTAVTTNTSITLGYMASGGQVMAADATAGFVQKFIPNKMYPRWAYIAAISKATQAVINFTGKNDYTVGENISFRVPTQFGMSEMNNKVGRVLAVTNSATVSSITVDINSSGFTTFAFPTSAVAAAGVSQAVAVPASSGVVPLNGSATVPLNPPGTNLLDAFDNRNQFVMDIGAGVLTEAASVYNWRAIKYNEYTAGP